MFEYKIEQINTAKTKPPKIEAQLTTLGQDGWELVSVVPDFDGEHCPSSYKMGHQSDLTIG
ncbi:DUF4177 domain-containing protein, partial [Phaeobacter sp. 22II1-1F12B]|uniref:DUF4177 domain-containing protein n=1 Tax=Phaeobacter sp. 22II1-1F12B TaxID=1317111 RepID=UPI000B6E84AB